MSKKHDEPERDEEAEITSRQAVLRAEKEAEERYLKEQAEKEAEKTRRHTSEDPGYKSDTPRVEAQEGGPPEVPPRFETGGATYDEKQEWYRANRPELADEVPTDPAAPVDQALRKPGAPVRNRDKLPEE